MINIIFLTKNKLLVGFDIKGHAGNKKTIKSMLVCASVSSAVLMITNTIIEVLKTKAKIETNNDGFLFLKIISGNLKICYKLLEGLELHFKELEKKYLNFLKVSRKEVEEKC